MTVRQPEAARGLQEVGKRSCLTAKGEEHVEEHVLIHTYTHSHLIRTSSGKNTDKMSNASHLPAHKTEKNVKFALKKKEMSTTQAQTTGITFPHNKC